MLFHQVGVGQAPSHCREQSFRAVKEQSSGLYAQIHAERDFLNLAFAPSFTGESGVEPRNVASPDLYTEDLSAAVD